MSKIIINQHFGSGPGITTLSVPAEISPGEIVVFGQDPNQIEASGVFISPYKDLSVINSATFAPKSSNPGSANTVWLNDDTLYLGANPVGGIELGPVGNDPNEAGATLTGATLNLEPVSPDHPGVVTTGTQEIEGHKLVRNLNVPTFWGPPPAPESPYTADWRGINFTHPEYADVRLVAQHQDETGDTLVFLPNVYHPVTLLSDAGGDVDGNLSMESCYVSAQNHPSSGIHDCGVTFVSEDKANFIKIECAAEPAASIRAYIPDLQTNSNFLFSDHDQSVTSQFDFTNGITTTDIHFPSGQGATIVQADTAAPATYTIPDVGATSSFVMTTANQTVGGVKFFANGIQLIGGNTLNYHAHAVITSNASGPWATSPSVYIAHTRTGVQVTVGLSAISGVSVEAAATNATVISFANVLPVGFRPVQNVYLPVWIKNNSAAEMGRLTITPAGVMTIERANGAAFTASGVAGFINTAVSFIANT